MCKGLNAVQLKYMEKEGYCLNHKISEIQNKEPLQVMSDNDLTKNYIENKIEINDQVEVNIQIQNNKYLKEDDKTKAEMPYLTSTLLFIITAFLIAFTAAFPFLIAEPREIPQTILPKNWNDFDELIRYIKENCGLDSDSMLELRDKAVLKAAVLLEEELLKYDIIMNQRLNENEHNKENDMTDPLLASTSNHMLLSHMEICLVKLQNISTYSPDVKECYQRWKERIKFINELKAARKVSDINIYYCTLYTQLHI